MNIFKFLIRIKAFLKLLKDFFSLFSHKKLIKVNIFKITEKKKKCYYKRVLCLKKIIINMVKDFHCSCYIYLYIY